MALAFRAKSRPFASVPTVVLHFITRCSYARDLLASRCSVVFCFRLLSVFVWAKERKQVYQKKTIDIYRARLQLGNICSLWGLQIEYAL